MRKTMNKTSNILKHVEFLDLVRIHVYRAPPEKNDKFPLRIEFEPLDKTKKIVFDETELKKMNEILTEKAQQFHPSDPRLKMYIEEFAARVVTELYRSGLVELIENGDSPENPYAHLRKQYSRN